MLFVWFGIKGEMLKCESNDFIYTWLKSRLAKAAAQVFFWAFQASRTSRSHNSRTEAIQVIFWGFDMLSHQKMDTARVYLA